MAWFDSFRPNQRANVVNAFYQQLLGRSADAGGLEVYTKLIRKKGVANAVQIMLRAFTESSEYSDRQAKLASNGHRFSHAPTALSRSNEIPKQIILAGSCLFDPWGERFAKHCQVERLTLNNLATLPKKPELAPESYDLQVIQLPLRAILPENAYLSLSYHDPDGYLRLFNECCAKMTGMLDQSMAWNSKFGMLTLVCNFLVPQQNPLGRFAPKYDFRNLAYFVERLNEELYRLISKYQNAYPLDIDQLSAQLGRRNHQDDAISVSVHHGLLEDFDCGRDSHRIEPVEGLSQYQKRIDQFIDAAWEEIVAIYRTIKGYDAVKLVIMDLDDSMWRGIAAESACDTFGEAVVEGWPAGVIEALRYIKQRGTLLAIASKNDENKIRELWPVMTGNRIAMSDFAITKINWRHKVENVKEILSETNLLPHNVLFIDDNPVERAAVEQAFPGIRVLGKDPYIVRHTLLRAPELQGVTITDESSRRTEMIQSQVKREGDRETMSRDDFLKSLSLQVSLTRIEDTTHPRFARAFELLNKTNQFNTTGKRWSHEQVSALFREGGEFQTFEVRDVHADYGLVGVVVIRDAHITQWAMSCRVLGLDVETAAAREIVLRLAASGATTVTAEVAPTDANIICRDLYERCGFNLADGKWALSTNDLDWQPYPHVRVAANA